MFHLITRVVASALVCGVISGAATTARAGASWPPNVNPYCAKNRPVVVAYTHPSWNFWANGGCFSDITAALVWAQAYGDQFTYAFKVNGIWSKAPGPGGIAQNGGPTQAYIDRIKQIRKQALEAKQYATQHVGKLTDQTFNQVNSLISQYSRERSSAQSKYPSYFPSSQFPYVSPIPKSYMYKYYLQYRSRSGGAWKTLGYVYGQSAGNNVKNAYESKYSASYVFRLVRQ